MSKAQKLLTASILGVILILTIGSIVAQKIKETKFNYEIEVIEKCEYLVYQSQGKYGVINKDGGIVIEAQYDDVEIPNPTVEIFVCYQGEDSKLVNSKNEAIYTDYQKVEPIKLKNVATELQYEKSILKYMQDGKYGILDLRKGKKITDPIYEEIESVSYKEGQLLIKQNGKLGVMNMNGSLLIKPEYDEIVGDNYYSENEGYKRSGYFIGVTTQEGVRYGYINYKGDLEINPECNEIYRITEIKDDEDAYLIIAKNGQFGFYKNENEVIPCEYQQIEYDKSNDMFIIEKTKKYGATNLSGQTIIPVENDMLEVRGIHLYARKGEEEIVYDRDGNSVNMDFNKIIMDTENENYRIVIQTKDSKSYYGLTDKEGNSLIEGKYTYLEYIYGDFFIASSENGKLGVVNSKGEVIVELKYDLVQKIQEKNAIQTLISDTNTREIYSSEMEMTGTMEKSNIQTTDDYIKLYSDKDLKYYDNNGNEITSQVILTSNTLFAQKRDGKWGFVDINNQEKVAFEYDKVTDFNIYGFAAIKKGNKWGSINKDGIVVQEPIYELATNLQEPEFVGKYYKTQLGFGENYYTDGVE